MSPAPTITPLKPDITERLLARDYSVWNMGNLQMSPAPTITPLKPDITERLLARDYSVWPEPAPGDGGDWLGWLDLPEALYEGREMLLAAHRELELAYTDQVVVLGMGGSSLASATLAGFQEFYQSGAPTRRLTVLDTINPRSIREFIETTDIEKCHFIVASKSGTTVEPLALEAIFKNELRSRGIDPVPRFTAISDPGTPLAMRAESGEFRRHIATPKNVGGRFSALTAFGMYPAALCNLLDEDMLSCPLWEKERWLEHPKFYDAYSLAKFMVKKAAKGYDKLTILTARELGSVGPWLEQLVAESTGKTGGGLIPTVDEYVDEDSAGSDRQFLAISSFVTDVEPRAQRPCYPLEVDHPSDITGLFFQLELAVAMASAGLGVYPFDQPDVEAAKQFARQVLESKDLPDIAPVSLSDAVDTVCAEAAPGRYVALCAFLPESPAISGSFQGLRNNISEATRMATTFGYGPRYLHSTGQVHKGGPDTIMQIVVVQDDSDYDVAVPGQDYSLAQLSRSQAVGDVLAMRELGRRSILVEVGNDAANDIREVSRALYERTNHGLL